MVLCFIKNTSGIQKAGVETQDFASLSPIQ